MPVVAAAARLPAQVAPEPAASVGPGCPSSRWALSLSVAGGMVLYDAAALIFPTPLQAADTPNVAPPNLGNGILSAAANNALMIDVTARAGRSRASCSARKE